MTEWWGCEGSEGNRGGPGWNVGAEGGGPGRVGEDHGSRDGPGGPWRTRRTQKRRRIGEGKRGVGERWGLRMTGTPWGSRGPGKTWGSGRSEGGLGT